MARIGLIDVDGGKSFPLMGVGDNQITQIQDQQIGLRQQRELAGNSICVNVLEDVFRQMFN